MRLYVSAAIILTAGIFSGSIQSRAQTVLALPDCETRPEVRQVIDDQLDYKLMDGMKYTERLAYQRKVLVDLIAKYPRELEPYETLRNVVRQFAPDDYPALRDQWVKRAKDNPDDPLALLLGGEALLGTDTPQAIHLFELARTKAPSFPGLTGSWQRSTRKASALTPRRPRKTLKHFMASAPLRRTRTRGSWSRRIPH